MVREHMQTLIELWPSLENFQLNSSLNTIRKAYHNLKRLGQSSLAQEHVPHQQVTYVISCVASRVTPKSEDAQVLSTNVHFRNQFGRQYRGDAPARFLRFVSQLADQYTKLCLSLTESRPYFEGTPIVQSSGTGKARMVLELRHYAPLLYVNFRNADKKANDGLPLADKEVRNYFVEALEMKTCRCEIQVACFLSAWFDHMADMLANATSSQERRQILTQLNEPSKINNNEQRGEFFKKVVVNAKDKLPSAARTHYHSSHEIIFKTLLENSVLRLNRELESVSELYSDAHIPPRSKPLVFVAIDECTDINIEGSASGNTPLNGLRSAWHYISCLRERHHTLRFWLLLISNSSSAAHEVGYFTSSSLRSAPISTFFGLGFDVLSGERAALTSASQAWQFDQLVKYGRPLWSSLEPKCFWSTAIHKLAGGQIFSQDNLAQCFAILASRLALRLVPVHPVGSYLLDGHQDFAKQAVDRHMRILTGVTMNGKLQVDSPSEPVLAIAASLIMLPNRAEAEEHWVLAWQESCNRYGAILEYFRRWILLSSSFALLKGTRGELSSRVALMAAWDAVKSQELAALPASSADSDDARATKLSEPVLLERILAGLIQLDPAPLTLVHDRIQSVCQEVRQLLSMDSDVEAELPTAPTQAGQVQAWTHFTHFDLMTEPITQISPEYLWYCWKRGVALQMTHGQGGVDGIIPVFVGDLEMPFAARSAEAGAADTADPEHDAELLAARHMTFVAWKGKGFTDETTTRRQVAKLAGPELMRYSRDARPVEQQRSLTVRGLLTVQMDLCTAAASDASQDQQPLVETIEGTDSVRVRIGGVTDARCYPCLDVLSIRKVFATLVRDVAECTYNESLNTVPSPLWNNQVQPDDQALP